MFRIPRFPLVGPGDGIGCFFRFGCQHSRPVDKTEQPVAGKRRFGYGANESVFEAPRDNRRLYVQFWGVIMNRSYPALAALMLCALSSTAIAAEDPAASCKKAASLYESGDLSGAVEEAKWCLEGLEQRQQAQKAEQFAPELAGWKRGELNQQKGMGFSTIDAQYSRDGKTIDVSYTGGGGGGMASMLSQMGMAVAGTKKIRLGHYTGLVIEDSAQNQILIALKMTPGMITLTSSSATLEEMTEFAGALPVADIDQ